MKMLLLAAVAAVASPYAGSIDVTAIPDSASWAMLIVAIATIGVSMRRRTQYAYVAFS